MTAEERASFVRMVAAIALGRALEDEARQQQDDVAKRSMPNARVR